MASNKERQKWQAESDAHTLSEAERIKNDKTRLSNAQKAAGEMLKNTQEQIDSLKKVSKTPVPQKTPAQPKTSAPKKGKK